MVGRQKIVFHPDSINEMWAHWKAGAAAGEIAGLLGVSRELARRLVSEQGGITPQPRRRSRRHLTIEEREEISRGIVREESARQIAARLGRSHTTVWREIERHGGRQRYRAALAEQQAWDNALRPQQCMLKSRPELCDAVAAKLTLDWSPQQISEWLKIEFKDDQAMRVSHETIYKSLFIQARGTLRKELAAHLRRPRTQRRPRAAGKIDRGHGKIVDAISISERPAEVEDRAVPGHWEGDLLMGKGMRSQIATLVERHSRFVMLVKVDSKHTEVVTEALAEKMHDLPTQLKRSLTWDRGTEMANHKKFSIATDLDVYFCDPHSPWQRGSNENTNGLLRQYFPKGTDLSVHGQEHLDFIADRLNTRPRQTLGFKDPATTLAEALR
jgi:IS30 family transposase